MSVAVPLDRIGRRPSPADNVAIAVRRLEAGTVVSLPEGSCTLSHTILEGHRFAVRAIASGEALLSWGLPFGMACAPIAPGGYVCNVSMLKTLSVRTVDGAVLPTQPNFEDRLERCVLDESAFRPGPAVEPVAAPRTFAGYRRPGSRGVGTRNCIVILGTTSRTGAYARQLAARLQHEAEGHPGLDGIVAVAHTEGDGPGEPNNAREVLRALAGFIVHPNVGAVLAVDSGPSGPVNNERLRAFMEEHGYPLGDVRHGFLSLNGGLSAAYTQGEAIVREWLSGVGADRRSQEPLRGLRIALQCGGSDAFSGVSGNPLAGAVAHEVIRHGGSANLCETDEAIGGEAYLLQNVRDLATARAFLQAIDSFRERLSWHGVTAESNPSGGNKLRGLYNITLKSLGAVHKKDPRTRLDAVIEYGQPMGGPGFYFMNSPGNDLEGIAGQVAAGCNLVLFVTGNGSVTNFPFVPTLKITTTTRRHELLVREMDINAGRYLDGEAMEALAAETFDLVCATVSGRRTRGEHAGHSQVSLWRNWPQTDASRLAELKARRPPSGRPWPLATSRPAPDVAPVFTAWRRGHGWGTERVGLVLPTSLCSAQIARLAAERLDPARLGGAVTRFVALAHTEGCGFGGESMHRRLHQTYRGYAVHPNVAAALFLEHGCEKVPNDVMRHELAAAGVDPERFGWASVQLGGGIDNALAAIETWFAERLRPLDTGMRARAGLGVLRIGLMTAATVEPATAAALAGLVHAVVGAGGSVLLPESDPLLGQATFCGDVIGDIRPEPSLAYGEPLREEGLHVVATETEHWVENLTGLGGCGVHLIVTVVGGQTQPGHPLVPVLQVAERSAFLPADDVDAFLSGDAARDESSLIRLVGAAAGGAHTAAASRLGFTDFQLTRGRLGVST
jgi:altronate dehydratase